MIDQETSERARELAPEPAPPALPNEEYYRRPTPQPAGSTARLGALLVLIGLVWLAVELVGYGPFLGETHGTTRIPAPLPNNRIELNLGAGDVEIVPGNSQEVTIETTQYGLWRGDPAVVSSTGAGAQVTNQATPRFGFCVGRCGLSYRITMPREANMTAQMTSGDFDISGASGLVSIATSSGDVEAHDIANGITIKSSSGDVTLDAVGGKLDVQTSSGEVRLEQGRVVDATVQTSSGDIELAGVGGDLVLQSGSGEIRVHATRDAHLDIQANSGDVEYTGGLTSDGQHSVTASSGEVTLHLPAASSFALEATTSSGELRNDFGLGGERQDEHSLSGTVGAGGPRLKIATSSGDIAIDRQ
jgi:Putative adhesin